MISYLKKADLPDLLQAWADKMDVLAPILEEGQISFTTWKGQPLDLSANALVSPAKIISPREEILFRYIQESGTYRFLRPDQKPRLIFGMRPCDLRALQVLDRIYGAPPPDQAYLDRRRSAVLAVLNCTNPGPGCFCAALGAGPDADEGYDLLFTDLGNGYLVESGSPAGIVLIKNSPDLLPAVSDLADSLLTDKGRVVGLCRDQVISSFPGMSVERIREGMESAEWERLGQICSYCAGCSFVCPVCHCFTIYDRGVPDGQRIRCADSCMTSGFSRLTSGSNPRPSQGDRLRNWYLDKFEYILARTGLAGCVGCGRCSQVCLSPDICLRSFLESLCSREMTTNKFADAGESKGEGKSIRK
ncbi:MAG: Sulfhydrogenase 1 subunit beta [Methanosaeta sp. PtaB.Bin039]|nr:MAG: Sulfhydrogenase 1 subunit beta [Methanosaeta sp. PtaB.Bin039]HOT06851.1 4Fe-4S dicluster domain-containing protein [Methanotrichaceae archaeon]HQF16747.1 4Fe-4S dicluster domain-containing protein [Methanotrichaceae archaeon]HQI91379.1 4Fe-4S dicluster domain-containing protein [Methanotrichaceae archaeon]HQJ28655.1 4Fe-4S dicluster domain-containing protein [Methanotrichaceae archaeon]